MLIAEIVVGTWRLSAFACTSFVLFDSINKFVAPLLVMLISRTCYLVCVKNDASSVKVSVPARGTANVHRLRLVEARGKTSGRLAGRCTCAAVASFCLHARHQHLPQPGQK